MLKKITITYVNYLATLNYRQVGLNLAEGCAAFTLENKHCEKLSHFYALTTN